MTYVLIYDNHNDDDFEPREVGSAATLHEAGQLLVEHLEAMNADRAAANGTLIKVTRRTIGLVPVKAKGHWESLRVLKVDYCSIPSLQVSK